jgi:hypothetical protein
LALLRAEKEKQLNLIIDFSWEHTLECAKKYFIPNG